MAKVDLPDGWVSEGDTVFVDKNQGGQGVFGWVLLIFAALMSVTTPLDASNLLGLIPILLSLIFIGVGLSLIGNSRVTLRWEIDFADKRLMQKKIRGSRIKVKRDRDLGRGAVLEITPSGTDRFTIMFEGPDWKETLGLSLGYSRTRSFAESLSDAIGIEIVDDRRRGLSEESGTWWEEKTEHDSEPEERMDMRMATRDPDAQIDESVIDGHIRLKGKAKMLVMTLVFVAVGLATIGFFTMYSGGAFLLVIAVPMILIIGAIFLIGSDAWTSVTVHDDKLVLRRLVPMRIESVTYKEVQKSSISAIYLERIWHEDSDN